MILKLELRSMPLGYLILRFVIVHVTSTALLILKDKVQKRGKENGNFKEIERVNDRGNVFFNYVPRDTENV